jgi:hypothetical protein
MDLRKWFLQQDRLSSRNQDLVDRTKHVPCSLMRSPSVLELFEMGFHTGFMLTDNNGVPTMALEMMAQMMGAQLCTAVELPDEERRGFGKDGPELIQVLDEGWYLRGITERTKSAIASMSFRYYRGSGWLWDFLPGLDGAQIKYDDPDGKRRKRVCYIASCPDNWEMDDSVYEGIWRWTRENYGPDTSAWSPSRWPDAYTLLGDRAALRQGGGADPAGRPADEAGTAPGGRIPPAIVCPQNGDATGHTAPSGD